MDDMESRFADLEIRHQALMELVVCIMLTLSHRDELFPAALQAQLDLLLRQTLPTQADTPVAQMALEYLRSYKDELLSESQAARRERDRLNAVALRGARRQDAQDQSDQK